MEKMDEAAKNKEFARLESIVEEIREVCMKHNVGGMLYLESGKSLAQAQVLWPPRLNPVRDPEGAMSVKIVGVSMEQLQSTRRFLKSMQVDLTKAVYGVAQSVFEVEQNILDGGKCSKHGDACPNHPDQPTRDEVSGDLH